MLTARTHGRVHRECLAIDVATRLTNEDVLERLSNLFANSGVREHIAMWSVSYVLLRDAMWDRKASYTLLDAKVLIERCRQHANNVRPHSALGYRPPAPESLQPFAVATAAPPQPQRAGLLEGKTLT
jgi:putative transposase